jgi:hypothetical protein
MGDATVLGRYSMRSTFINGAVNNSKVVEETTEAAKDIAQSTFQGLKKDTNEKYDTPFPGRLFVSLPNTSKKK